VRSRVGRLRPPIDVVLAAVPTALAAALRLTSLGQTPTDPFYDAAVRSMSQSWHNFLLAAFDPSGGTSVDKPPLDLWLQVAGVKVFGYGAIGRVIPAAVAGTIAVALLYAVVRRLFGRFAALASALAFAVLPVSVLTSRSNTPDTVVMVLTLLAALLVVRAVETGRARFLYFAGFAVGLAFEAKVFEALLAVPAIALLHLVCSRVGSRARARQGAVSIGVLVITGLSWATLVSVVPSSPPYYAIGSADGSVWNAIFVYNGVDRISPSRDASPRRSHGDVPAALRLFQLGVGKRSFGQTVGVELAPAFIFGGIASLFGAVALARRRQTEAGRRSRALPVPLAAGGALSFGLWLLVAFAVLSRSAVVHLRYAEVMAPAVAAALGAGTVASARLAARQPLALVLFLGGLCATTVYAVKIAAGDHVLAEAIAAAAAGAAVAAISASIVERRGGGSARPARLAGAAAVCCLASLLLPALVRSRAIVDGHESASGGTSAQPLKWVRRVSDYLRSHSGGYYELASYAYPHAAPLIVRDGRPVLVLMNSHRPIVTVPRLARELRAGRVRYALIEGHCGADPIHKIRDCPASVRWLRARSADVSAAAGLPARGALLHISGPP
jgi:4-amino-4-deoxy-L-arabinose transferase-like glycosyltransferase